MRTKMMLPFLVLAFTAGCDRDGVARADQKDYEIVQEGSASGVTSTIRGPGETLPPITGTNADTTTAFSIDPNVMAAAPPENAPLSGSMPPDAYTPPTPRPTYTPPAPLAEPVPPREEPAPERAESQPPPTVTETASEQAPPEEEEDPPPSTKTDTRGQQGEIGH